MSKPGTTVQFRYDHNGLRTQKVVTENGTTATTNYTLHGKLITHLTRGVHNLHFFYDAQGQPAKVNFNGDLYTYVHNLQGDVVGLLDNAGALVVEYKYDAWGKPIAQSTLTTAYEPLASLNPFRYRGYVFDEETGLYYLRSRYYQAERERFLNADCGCGSVGVINSHSTFTYCNNEPVDQADHNGRTSKIVSNIVNSVSDIINSVQEFTMRTLINAICGRKHASKIGEFSITSITKGVTIKTTEADSHNGLVSEIVDMTFRGIGFIIGGYIGSAAKFLSKITETFAGGFVVDKITGAIQDEIISWFTVRDGTYISIHCQYRRDFKVLFLFSCMELHSYELRIYPDYCEVWYSFFHNGFEITILPPLKLGGMTMEELKDALRGG